MNIGELTIENLKSEVHENFRLRLGLWATLAIFLLWISLVWSDLNAEFYDSLRDLKMDQAALQDIESADVWQQRSLEASEWLELAEAGLWRAESEGLAKAKLQSALATLSGGSEGRQSIKVGIPQALVDLEGVSRVRARIGVSLTPAELLMLLEKLESMEQLMVVDQFNVKKIRGDWNVEVMVSAFFDSTGWGA